MSMTLVVIGLGALLLIANVWVCIAVLRSSIYSQRQKVLQCSLVWLLPVFGPIIVWSLLRSLAETIPTKNAFDPQSDQGVSGIEFQHPNPPGGPEL
jgi:hypothetical protein